MQPINNIVIISMKNESDNFQNKRGCLFFLFFIIVRSSDLILQAIRSQPAERYFYKNQPMKS